MANTDSKVDRLERKILWWEDHIAKEREKLDVLYREKVEPLQQQYRKELGIDD